ncbi:MAG: flagellin B [Helicobacter sp.]|nr:flagellin B [Helicobacter sp.]
MAFQINTNIHALNARAQGTFTQNMLTGALERLSSGLRINKAADDASGMAIADSLRSQANSLGQAIRNTNDGIGIVQIADKAMDEQVKILDTIKVKAVQAAQDGQTTKTRTAIQADITRLIASLDNIGQTTSYNGLALLSGSFTNKEFQVGAYSNQSVKLSIGPTTSDKIGHVRSFTTGEASMRYASFHQQQAINIPTIMEVTDPIRFRIKTQNQWVELEGVVFSHSAGTGYGALAEVINRHSEKLDGLRASFVVQATASGAVSRGDVNGLNINGVEIGNITDIQDNDRDGKLINAINARKEETGIQASIDAQGRLNLTSMDGRGILVRTDGAADHVFGGNRITGQHFGRMTLTRLGAGEISISVRGGERYTTLNGTPARVRQDVMMTFLGLQDKRGLSVSTANPPQYNLVPNPYYGGFNLAAEDIINLRDTLNPIDANTASAIGANANIRIAGDNATGISAGVTTLRGAMVMMNIAESAMIQLNRIRSDLGSVQQQLMSTLNNITVTQVNVKAAESNIRDVDFAEESSNYTKLNLLSQAGNYALSQANMTQQNIMRLLT